MSNQDYNPISDAVSVGVITTGPIKGQITLTIDGTTYFLERHAANYLRRGIEVMLDVSATAENIRDQIEKLEHRGY